MLLTLKFKWGYTMNSFQKQFNSLLGLALGAQKLGGETEKVLGTPSAPVAAEKGTPEAEFKPTKKTKGDYKRYELGFGSPWEESLAATTTEASSQEMKRYYAKQRSLQNLRNRHEALRAIKREKDRNKVLPQAITTGNAPRGSIVSNRDLGGVL